jgi:rRNA maturation protein Nop10
MPFCPKCGSEVTSDAAFCPKCGAQLVVSAIPPVTPVPPVERRRHDEKREKGEKQGEKGEKQEKGGDKTVPIVGGLILIWLGVMAYLAQTQYMGITWANGWGYFLLGIGVILVLQAVIRYVTLPSKGSAIGSLIGGFVLIIVGLAGAYGIQDWWYLVFIAIGVVVIISGITATRRNPRP